MKLNILRLTKYLNYGILLLVRALEQGSRANVLVEIPVRPEHPKSWMIILFSLDKSDLDGLFVLIELPETTPLPSPVPAPKRKFGSTKITTPIITAITARAEPMIPNIFLMK